MKTDFASNFEKYCKDLCLQTKMPNVFTEGKVAFSHFVFVEFKPTVTDLLQYFKRGAAIFCKNGQSEERIMSMK